MSKLPVAICALTVAVSSAAHAEVNFNGFASIYGGLTLDNNETLYGYDDDLGLKPQSLFGLQATSDLGEGITATAQMIARGAQDFDSEFEWAYLTYSVSEVFDVSAGRIRIPFYKYSEFLDVGYAYPWARTPQDVYGTNFNTMEGLRFNYNAVYGQWDAAWQLVHGRMEDDISIGGASFTASITGITSISLDLSKDWLAFRLGYTQGDVSMDTGLEAAAPLFGSSAIFNDVLIAGDYGYFANVGVFIDYNDWLFSMEAIEYTVEDSLIGVEESFYVMLGKRFGDFTLSYTYSEAESSNDFSAADNIVADVGPLDPACPVTTTADFFRACVIDGERKNDVNSLTLRWDFSPGAALKVDYSMQDYSRLNNASSNVSNDLLSVGVDLVF